ncbi:hypothetical protein [Paraherbaspirillum soli]|uniref:Methanethiol oxidase n=1 Tax=Paraherbaspirillum soli TaxID=631222 RepID=A0ABW0M631_9BURK
MMHCELILINSDTDEMAKVMLPQLRGWNPATCQHTMIASDEKTAYVTTDAVPPFKAAVVAVKLGMVDWANHMVNAEILQTLELDPSGTRSSFPAVTQTDKNQPIMPWSRPLYTQTHAPTILPHSKFVYLTHYTDDRIRGFEVQPDGKLEQKVLYRDHDLTRQTHGVNFNDAGTVGLGVGYDYDMSDLRVYTPNRETGAIKVTKKIHLGEGKSYGAFAHYAVWLNDRYAYMGTMQKGATSTTPKGFKIIEPSVWLIDVQEGTAKRVIGTASTSGYGTKDGLLRSPSDIAIVGNKMYVAEEDSWGEKTNAPKGDYGRDGYISIWDISKQSQPKLIKRLSPGDGELPADFRNAHTASAMLDGDFVFVSSFISNYLIKIDTKTDKVVKVFSKADGLEMFHGEFAAGRNR